LTIAPDRHHEDQGEPTMNNDWVTKAEFAEVKAMVEDAKYRVDQMASDYEKLTRHRDMLAAALMEITDAYRTASGRVPVVITAERVLEDIAADGFYDEIAPWLEKEQIDRWIDATGTAPPGIDIDHLV
jgi:hypothetical protein